MLGEDVYREKNSSLRDEEESLKKLLAGYELRQIERERSEGYINRVKDFLDGYDDSKEKIDFATKKELAGLLFKNIKIAQKKIFSFAFFAPFNFFFLEQKQKSQCQTNKRLIKNLAPKSTSGLSDDRWCKYRDMILGILKGLSDLE